MSTGAGDPIGRTDIELFAETNQHCIIESHVYALFFCF